MKDTKLNLSDILFFAGLIGTGAIINCFLWMLFATGGILGIAILICLTLIGIAVLLAHCGL